MKTLYAIKDSAHPYAFDFEGIEITNPIIDEDGLGVPVSPEYYGFKVTTTGGGCTAHAQYFLLDGKKVLMLITDGDANCIDKDSISATIGIYDEDMVDPISDTWQVSR